MIMNSKMKILAVTKEEAELILDAVRVGNPQTRTLALKVAGLVLEYAAEEAVCAAQEQVLWMAPMPEVPSLRKRQRTT
jgi:hypothetical protein